jgi:hypothetical protein
MAFIPPEIGVGVKNRFTYSEIHTFQGGFLPRSGPGMSTLAVASFGNSSIPNAFAKSLLLLWARPAWGSGAHEARQDDDGQFRPRQKLTRQNSSTSLSDCPWIFISTRLLLKRSITLGGTPG